MICTELMILTHVGPFFLPVRHNTQPIGDERLRGEGSEGDTTQIPVKISST